MSALSGNPAAVELAERGDIAGAVAAQMRSAEANGCHPDGVVRSGRLFLIECERVLKQKVTKLQFEAGLLRLEQFGSEGKAAANQLRMEVLEHQMEQIKLNPHIQGGGIHGAGGGKAVVHGLAREKRRALRRFIEDIGGSPADGGYASDLLDYEPHHVERAMLLIRGEAEPETDAERTAVERWQEKHGEGSP